MIPHISKDGIGVSTILGLALLAVPMMTANAGLAVRSDFPGGSAEVLRVDQKSQLVSINPENHADRGWTCWWYAKISGIDPQKPLTLEVGDTFWSTPDRATFSTDGRTWKQSELGKRAGSRIRYQLDEGSKEILVAWGPPFLHHHAEALVREVAKTTHATPFSLCTTREGRTTPAIRFYPSTMDNAPAIWIHARQHAWEAGSSWVATGLIKWLASNSPEAKFLRNHSEITVVPIMDIDNVQRGAGGKNQLPHDHNRDWTDTPHWNAVKAAQNHIKSLDAEGRLHLFVDLHNPGARDRFPYYYIPPKEILSHQGAQNLDTFLTYSQSQMRGPLRYLGRAIESGANYDPKAWKAISKNWVAMNCQEHVVSVTLETAWNTPASTVEGYEVLGEQLGRSMSHYIKGLLGANELAVQ